jgi:toxin ParE1/3/4
MPPTQLSPRARIDLLEAVKWIAKDNRIAARGLREAAVHAAKRLGKHPQLGMMRPELADDPVRFLPLTGYPYLIVYDSAEIPPLILRMLHGARDLPGLFSAGTAE